MSSGNSRVDVSNNYMYANPTVSDIYGFWLGRDNTQVLIKNNNITNNMHSIVCNNSNQLRVENNNIKMEMHSRLSHGIYCGEKNNISTVNNLIINMADSQFFLKDNILNGEPC
jgi:hypothetical protein